MFSIKWLLVVLLFCGNLCAVSVYQTDWSGGPGTEGPVLEFASDFYIDTDVNWAVPGEVELGYSAEYTIDDRVNSCDCVCTSDIDGDGDLDVVGTALFDDLVIWWENSDGTGTSWVYHQVAYGFEWPIAVASEDIDGDGDMDVIGAARESDEITWWENIDGEGTIWDEHVIHGSFNGAKCVAAADIDGDGNMDVLGTAGYASDVTWWRNNNGLGTSWTKYVIDSLFFGDWICSADINGDGYEDVLATGGKGTSYVVYWWENTDGTGTSWVEHSVDGDVNGTKFVATADVDGDGDEDVLGVEFAADLVVWWENTDGAGTSWATHTVASDFESANAVVGDDLDGDGDIDLIGAAMFGDEVAWWENTDGTGLSWDKHVLNDNAAGATCVSTGDLNGDGMPDVVGAIRFDGEALWWNVNRYSYAGSVESSILDTDDDPLWGSLDWNSTEPPGTSISMQVRSSETYTNMGAWTDTLLNPCSLEGLLPDGDRYIQYRAILSSTDPDTTPILKHVVLQWDLTGIGETSGFVNVSTKLLPFQPNPLSGTAVIRFHLDTEAAFSIQVYDLSGRSVREFSSDSSPAGTHEIPVDGLAGGIYLCRMVSGSYSETERFVLFE